MWINVTTGAVCKLHSDIRKDKPETSFPAVITDEVIAEAGYEPITPTAADFDAATHEAIETSPAKVGGAWVQQWEIVELSDEKRSAKVAELNAPIYAAMEALDAKSIRPLREGDQIRIAAIEAQIADLRKGLVQ